jgi:hypothetical protein
MTANKGGFDPFAYGQVQLRKDPPATDAEAQEMLFTGGGTPAREESSWELPPQDVAAGMSGLGEDPASMSADSFGAEILGVGAPAHAPKRPGVVKKPANPAWQGGAVPAEARPGAPRLAGDPSAPGGPETQRRPQLGGAGLGEPAKERFADTPALRPALPRRHVGVLGLFVPLLTLAAGTSGSAWLFLVERDPVTAAISALLTCVATAFTWIWLRG